MASRLAFLVALAVTNLVQPGGALVVGFVDLSRADARGCGAAVHVCYGFLFFGGGIFEIAVCLRDFESGLREREDDIVFF